MAFKHAVLEIPQQCAAFKWRQGREKAQCSCHQRQACIVVNYFRPGQASRSSSITVSPAWQLCLQGRWWQTPAIVETLPFASHLLTCPKRLRRSLSTKTVKLSGLFQPNLLENRCLKDLVSTGFKEEVARQRALLLSLVKEKLKYKVLYCSYTNMCATP